MPRRPTSRAAPRDAPARRDRIQDALFLLRLLLLVTLCGVALRTGWANALAAALSARIAPTALVCAAFAACAALAYEILLFPLSRFAQTRLDALAPDAALPPPLPLGRWLRSFFLSLALEMAAVAAVALAFRILWVACGPVFWAFPAAALYVALGSESLPLAVLARLAPLDPLPSADALLPALRDAFQRVRRPLPLAAVAVWRDEPPSDRPVHLLHTASGIVAVLPRTLAARLDSDSIVLLVVLEAVRRYRRRLFRLVLFAAAAVVFGLTLALARLLVPDPAAPRAIPLLVAILFPLATAAALPLNAWQRIDSVRTAARAVAAVPGRRAAFRRLVRGLQAVAPRALRAECWQIPLHSTLPPLHLLARLDRFPFRGRQGPRAGEQGEAGD